jgi:AraC-like DNA-binding protein
LALKVFAQMSRVLLLENFGKINLRTGIPPGYSGYVIPAALNFQAEGSWGILFLQEIKTTKYLLRHFLFSLKQSISFFNEDDNSKLQSLLTINGRFDFEIADQGKVGLKKKEYLLFSTAGKTSLTTAYKGQSSLLIALYTYDFYRELTPYFVGLKEDLRKAIKKPHYFNLAGKIAKTSVHYAIKAIWEEKYIPALQSKHIELHLESSLFTMFAQSYGGELPIHFTPVEKKFAEEAEKIILQNLKVHLTTDEIARQLNCSDSWLRKTFRKVHGVPMFHFLRTTRMHYARQQILSGVSMKAVAIDLGMNPSNFPKEFKAFFGHTVSSLKKGRY